MKLYSSRTAPNPRRVHVLIAHKGIEVEVVDIDLSKGEHFSEEYQRINPDRVVPALVLEDGTVITESLAICRHLDAAFPQVPVFGTDPRSIGLVEMWCRRFEIQLYIPVQDAYRNSRPGFSERALPGARGGVAAIPALVERQNAVARRFLERLDAHLAEHELVCGETVTMPDIMGVVAIDFAHRTKMAATQDMSTWPNVVRWHAAMSERPAFRDN